ncbi:Lactate dehydrogenase [Carabus blaptoides fortunei]
MSLLSKLSNRVSINTSFTKYFLNFCMQHDGSSKIRSITTKSTVIHPISCEKPENIRKISVIGAAGLVGTAVAVNLLLTNVCDEVVLMDVNENKLLGEEMDLNHARGLMKLPKISSTTNFENTAGSCLIIITSGITKKSGQTRLDIVHANAELFKQIIPKIVKHSPNSILLILTNPVDLMTYVAWKISCFEENRVIGSGTELDSSRFRYLISERLGVNPTCVHGWIIGEHGDSSVPIWSEVNIAGTRLQDINPDIGSECDPEQWNEIHKEVVKAGYVVHDLKGHTNWAVSAIAQGISRAILTNAKTIHAVSTQVKGMHGINSDVFISLPCVLGNSGVSDIINQCLTKNEQVMLQESVCILDKIKNTLKL